MRLFILLLVLWLVLNESIAPVDWLLGGLFAFLGTLAFARLEPRAPRWSRPGTVAALLGTFLADMVQSNFEVARIVLGLGRRNRKAGFLKMPLELRDPAGLAVMACIVTSTPGTSWVRYERSENWVMIHVLDLVDEAAWIALFKQLYEQRLLRIFQ